MQRGEFICGCIVIVIMIASSIFAEVKRHDIAVYLVIAALVVFFWSHWRFRPKEKK